MKDSYMGDTIDLQLPSQQEPDESIRDNDFTELLTFPGGSLLGDQNMDTEGENGDCPILAQAQLRASIPPLDISLDDIDPNMDKLVGQDQGNIDEAGTVNERNKKKANKKAKKERSLQFLHFPVFGQLVFVRISAIFFMFPFILTWKIN